MSTKKPTGRKSGAAVAKKAVAVPKVATPGPKTPLAVADDDPVPVPPERPAPEECCNSGCIPCVYDLYDDAMDRYREALKDWHARHAPGSS